MRRTFKYRVYANRETIGKTEKALSLCRDVYNVCLEQRRDAWKLYKRSVSCHEQIKQLPELKKELPEFKLVPSQTLQNVVERVDKAFRGYFRRVKSGKKPGYPRFKTASRYNSLTLKQSGWKLEGNKLRINKLGDFKVKLHRPIMGEVKTVTVSRSASGKWYACFSCGGVEPKPLPKTGKAAGIDVGCESFLTDSGNRKVKNPRFLRQKEKLIGERQRSLSKKKKGSKGSKKARKLLALACEEAANARKDFHFKAAKQLLRENDVIYIEDLRSWNGPRGLNKSMRDAGWFRFFEILLFKAEEAGKEVIKVPAGNTTQKCSRCGEIVRKELSDRVHDCPFCGFRADRDYNAALNIYRIGASLRGKELPREAPCGSTG